MERDDKLFYKNGGSLIELEPGGYIAHKRYLDMVSGLGYYYAEPFAIEKINKNEEGFFDFSKSIVDIGAEIGTYSWGTKFDFAHLFDGNQARLICAQMNMLMRDREGHFKAYHTLLSDVDENIEYNGFYTEYSNAITGKLVTENNQILGAKTLDEFGLDNVGFIKVDVEGMELKVLRGAAGTIIRNNYPPILFELWAVDNTFMTEEKYNATKDFIEGFGYEILWGWADFQTHLAVKRQ